MIYTKQPRSLPVIDKPEKLNTEIIAIQPFKTDDSKADEINKDLVSIQFGLSSLYTKLQELNFKLEMFEKEKNSEN